RITGRAIVSVLAGEVVGVLAHVEGADEDGASALEAPDEGRVGAGGGPLTVDLGSSAGRQASDVEQVLGGEGRADERAQFLAAGARGVDRFRSRQRARRSQVSEGAGRCISRRDAIE